jgi:hypothetical protein
LVILRFDVCSAAFVFSFHFRSLLVYFLSAAQVAENISNYFITVAGQAPMLAFFEGTSTQRSDSVTTAVAEKLVALARNWWSGPGNATIRNSISVPTSWHFCLTRKSYSETSRGEARSAGAARCCCIASRRPLAAGHLHYTLTYRPSCR